MEMMSVVRTVALFVGETIITKGAWFGRETLIVTKLETEAAPSLSMAFAEMACVPTAKLVVNANGAVESVATRLSSMKNSTVETVSSSVALADIVIVLVVRCEEPFTGEVIATAGAWFGGVTLIEIEAAVVETPLLSVAFAEMECVPGVKLVVNANGAVESIATRLSSMKNSTMETVSSSDALAVIATELVVRWEEPLVGEVSVTIGA